MKVKGLLKKLCKDIQEHNLGSLYDDGRKFYESHGTWLDWAKSPEEFERDVGSGLTLDPIEDYYSDFLDNKK